MYDLFHDCLIALIIVDARTHSFIDAFIMPPQKFKHNAQVSEEDRIVALVTLVLSLKIESRSMCIII